MYRIEDKNGKVHGNFNDLRDATALAIKLGRDFVDNEINDADQEDQPLLITTTIRVQPYIRKTGDSCFSVFLDSYTDDDDVELQQYEVIVED